ncbi:MAG: recombinase RecT, partial [Caldisericaceae bacterium]
MNQEEMTVSFKDDSGSIVTITRDNVVNVIAPDAQLNDVEVSQFLNMCKYLKLNPFTKEVFIIKHSGSPATFIESFHSFLKRAERNQNFDGYDVTVEGNI